MDGYPKHLAPAFNDGGGVETPFEEWWPRVAGEFPTVPDDVARYWLHEHWGHSPYGWLPSRAFRFDPADWPLSDLALIRSRWCAFAEDHHECLEHGRYLLSAPTLKDYPTRRYMLEHGRPPARLIVLDNRAGLPDLEVPPCSPRADSLPAGYVLIEGHRRFNLALALQDRGALRALPVWLMTRRGPSG